MSEEKFWWETEIVNVELDNEIIEVFVSWNLEKEDEGSVGLNFSIEDYDNFFIGNFLTKWFHYVDYENDSFYVPLLKAKNELISQLINIDENLKLKIELKDMLRTKKENKLKRESL